MPVDPAFRRTLAETFFGAVPFNRALNLRLEHFEEGEALLRLPFDERWSGNPETGALHGGAITALTDACCGLAAFLALDPPQTLATLDLRIDHLRAAVVGRDLLAHAVCYRQTQHLAFVRCTAYYEETPADAVAAVVATFMIGTPSRRRGEGDGG
jgi:uncharacterized protein (TIGR00369 family)